MTKDESDSKDLSKYRMSRANEDLKSANILFDEDLLEAANNRAYYACYHGMDAVLAMESVGFKRHKDTLAYFNKNYIKTGIFSKENGRILHNLKEVRENSDYEDFFVVSKNETKDFISFAEEFIKSIEEYLAEKWQ